MIQFIYTPKKALGNPSDRRNLLESWDIAIELPAIPMANTSFSRDRTLVEAEDYIREMIRANVWSPGQYIVYHDGQKMGTLDISPDAPSA